MSCLSSTHFRPRGNLVCRKGAAKPTFRRVGVGIKVVDTSSEKGTTEDRTLDRDASFPSAVWEKTREI